MPSTMYCASDSNIPDAQIARFQNKDTGSVIPRQSLNKHGKMAPFRLLYETRETQLKYYSTPRIAQTSQDENASPSN